MIPFNREFRGDAADKSVHATLRGEALGIVAWMVQGCLLWQKEELGTPLIVAKATADYQAKSDHLELFLDECCEREVGSTVGTMELFNRYKEWAGDIDEVPLSVQVFTENMEKKGFKKDRISQKRERVWRGLRFYGADASGPGVEDTAEASSVTT